MAVKIIFCYAHEDEPLLNQLKMHLSLLERIGLIEMWYDREINAGAEWEHVWWSQKSRQFLVENKTKHNHSRILVSSARIDLRWRLIVQRLMKPLVIVKREIRSQVAHRVWNALVIFDIHLLIFDTAP